MKKKFVRPQISTYSVQSASGQDALDGVCLSGSFAGAETGSCAVGTNPTGGNCYPGAFPSGNQCRSGNNVFPGTQCTTGDVVLPRPNICNVGSTPNV